MRWMTVMLWGVIACGGSGGSPGGADAPGAGQADAPLAGDDAGADAAGEDASGDDAPDAPPPASGDPADDGAFTVDQRTVSIAGAAPGRTLPATVFTPEGGPTPRPVILISCGFQMARSQYVSYARHLATWGFGVVLTDYADAGFFPDHTELAADLSAAIDWAIADAELAADAGAIGLAGHSLGGKISLLTAADDARVGAVVGWDPVDSTTPSVAPQRMDDVSAAVAVIGETTNASGGGMPCAPAAENFTQFYAAAGSPALQMTIVGADHMDWVDDGSCAFCGFCTAGAAEPARARVASRRLDVAWFRRHLQGDVAMDPWLSDPPEVAAGVATVVRK